LKKKFKADNLLTVHILFLKWDLLCGFLSTLLNTASSAAPQIPLSRMMLGLNAELVHVPYYLNLQLSSLF
jgi:hypothetical protein